MPISGHLSSARAAKGATAIRHGMLPRDRADTEQVRAGAEGRVAGNRHGMTWKKETKEIGDECEPSR